MTPIRRRYTEISSVVLIALIFCSQSAAQNPAGSRPPAPTQGSFLQALDEEPGIGLARISIPLKQRLRIDPAFDDQTSIQVEAVIQHRDCFPAFVRVQPRKWPPALVGVEQQMVATAGHLDDGICLGLARREYNRIVGRVNA